MRLHVGTSFLDADHNLLNGQQVMERARWVEEAGLDGVWMGDSLGATRRTDPFSWLLTSALAAPSLEVGTCILIISVREPVQLAQQMLTLQALTNNRYTFGVGTGGPDPAIYDVVGRGHDWDNRFKLMTSVIDKVRSIANGAPTSARGTQGTWPELIGGPRIMIGAYGSGIWVKRAARLYDGWVASAGRTDVQALEEGIKRFHDAGGTRAAVCSVFFDFTGTRRPLGDMEGNNSARQAGYQGGSFNLQCSPEEASERLQILADLGYTDVILPKRQQGFGYYEPTVTKEDLATIRSLLPKDTNPKPWQS